MRIRPTIVSKCIIRLERSDKCIEKIKPGIYKVNHTDLRKCRPYNKFLKYCLAVVIYDGFLNMKWEERANLIGISIEEVIMVNGYWVEFIKNLNDKITSENNLLELHSNLSRQASFGSTPGGNRICQVQVVKW